MTRQPDRTASGTPGAAGAARSVLSSRMRSVPAASLVAALATLTACARPALDPGGGAPGSAEPARATTAGAIAIANLDHQIAQAGDGDAAIELLLTRARFLADHDALARATALTEPHGATPAERLRRARTRAAAHRFADALDDLAAAGPAGARSGELAALRGSILVATGRAADALPALEAAAARRPGFAAWSALAAAYGALDRIDDADRLYAAALADLDTTSPFPYAWIDFARGRLWAEHGDPARAAPRFAQALATLPAFTAAAIELAELEAAHGDVAPAIARLERVTAATDEPEALGLLGALRIRAGDPARGELAVAQARRRFEALLARFPLAFADHAAEFYLGAGGDAERAWALARENLAARPTPRAFALATAAARATGRDLAPSR